MTSERGAEIGLCRDCRHWDQNDGGRREDIGACRAIPTDSPTENGKAIRLAWNVGGCPLVTRPDFGCVQFEVRG